MENEKRKNLIIVLLVIIILLLATLLVLLLTGKVNYKGNTNNNEPINNVVDNNQNDISALPKWANYLLEQNITDIEIHNRKLTRFDPEVGCDVPEKISKEQLKNILQKMGESQLIKYKQAAGFGGPCLKQIVIKYDNQQLELLSYKFIITKDTNINSLLENDNYKEENMNAETGDIIFAYNWDTSYIDTLF